MTKYKCGCESDGSVIIDKNILSFINYEDWSKSVGVFGTKELCLYCWQEKNNVKAGLFCGYKKGKWVRTHKTEKVNK